MRRIRLEMNYSVRDFAMLLGLPAPTLQGYDNGTRKTPAHTLNNAKAAQKREREFFKGLNKRVDAALKGKLVPNEARPDD